jgi:cytochrome c5
MPFLLCVLPLTAVASGGEVHEKRYAPCHSSGDIKFPQNGSAEPWELRSVNGAKSLLDNVKNGHNIMPPHEGALKDDEMAAAIDYLVTKSGGWARE